MRKLLDKFKTSRIRRRQLSLERWEEQREKGQRRFVLKQALTWAVMMTSIRDVYEQIFAGDGEPSNLWHYFITYSLVGIFVGYTAWSRQEGEYKSARLNRRLQTRFDERIKPR
jgi:hypothetical protein